MSSPETQTDLSEFQTGAEIVENEGYEVPDWTPLQTEEDEHPEDCCQNCGYDVTLQYRRVFGNNENVVYGCPECSTYREVQEEGHHE